jgi:hypothetical protein
MRQIALTTQDVGSKLAAVRLSSTSRIILALAAHGLMRRPALIDHDCC